jgi:histidyl-tRNA synthetase
MLDKIRGVYERYGFEPLETPAFEYTDALGKFLPDQDRPNEGVFSLEDEDEQWLSLRYDLTAPLARYVAQNFQTLTKPFRRYAVGRVWRNEKPGPGRFREFMQFDADTVGTDSVAADAEMCMLAADTMEALLVETGDYVIKVNNRKVLDGVLGTIGLDGAENSNKRLIVLRAVDKMDRLGVSGVRELLGRGRKDESGDFTPGAGLDEQQIKHVLAYVRAPIMTEGESLTKRPAKREMRNFIRRARDADEPDPSDYWYRGSNTSTLKRLCEVVSGSELGLQGLDELEQLVQLTANGGYGCGQILIDPSVVRGLDYYTGFVFEADLTFEVKDEKGRPVQFGSVGGGGRYDDLVARFTGQKVPATGFSIGVSRLQAALTALGRTGPAAAGPVIVTVMEKDRIADYQEFVQALRSNDIRAELYLGNPKKFGKQLEYADKRGSPCVVIQGSDERSADPPQVVLKDLIEGAKAAAAIQDNKEWKETRPAQVSVKEADLVEEVRKILARHGL